MSKRKRRAVEKESTPVAASLPAVEAARFGDKVLYLFGRYLVVTVAYLAAYSCIHWLLVLQWNLFDPYVFMSHWLLPGLLAIPVYRKWLRHRIGLLLLTKTQRGALGSFTWLLICANAITCQYFVVDFGGRVVEINTPQEASEHRGARYYFIRQHFVNKEQIKTGDYITKNKSGKSNRHTSTTFTTVICAPLEADHLTRTAAGDLWIRRIYDTTISNKQSDYGRSYFAQQFKDACLKTFQLHNQDEFIYLRRPDKGEDWEKPYNVAGFFPESPSDLPLILDPVNTPFNQRYYRYLGFLCFSLLSSLMILFILYTRPAVDPVAWQQYRQRSRSSLRRRLPHHQGRGHHQRF